MPELLTMSRDAVTVVPAVGPSISLDLGVGVPAEVRGTRTPVDPATIAYAATTVFDRLSVKAEAAALPPASTNSEAQAMRSLNTATGPAGGDKPKY